MKIHKILFAAAAVLPLFCSVMSCTSNDKTSGAKDAMEVIFHRSSVRAYTDEPVSEEDVTAILKAGMAAPSALNYQPWSFVVVRDRETMQRIGEKVGRPGLVGKAPLLIVVCGKTTWERGGETIPNPFWQQDCSAVTQNILLAVDYFGLGAVWNGCYPGEDRAALVKSVLGLPEDVEALSVIIVGHPDGEPAPKDKWDPERIHQEKW